MILSGILGALALLSFLLTLWQWSVAWRFPLHRRSAGPQPGTTSPSTDTNEPGRRPSPQPAVTLLKPLKGCDEHTEACLRSWLAQEYAGEVQTLFAVADLDDPASDIVKQLLAEFPQRDVQFVICPEWIGASAKVSKLAHLEPHAKHEILVVSDADVRVPADLLTNVVASLTPSFSSTNEERVVSSSGAATVGLVNCFFQLAPPTTLAMHWETIAINVDFWSQVLQSRSLKPLDFALGAVMVLRRKHLAEIGGFRALADYLADDYQLGQRIARRGYRIELCPVVVECWSPPMSWGEVWRHQLRWARTVRVCQPAPYFFSLLSNATLWPLLWLLAHPSLEVLELSLVFVVGRIIAARFLHEWLTQATRDFAWWLVPVKDLLQAAIWALAFAGNRIEWRGEHYRVRRDGKLEKSPRP